ncbi:pyridoxal phosphate-dependent aminotransferase [Flavobacterium soli]|uniref:pyridoxal phosphate-dependent aminotransferase n=1 Tax=Flavobacterium soli TaxID=344881 RepID=UPI000479CD22|nr:aminotransferase class I/II-fold pyridoxal phosphate-dependent enzyme [Flavobacterium soli]
MIINSKIQESPTLKFAQAARDRSEQGEKIISLGLGEPEFQVPIAIVEATKEILSSKKSGYSNPMGLPNLRKQIAQKLFEENKINCDETNILVTAGAKQAFQIICSVLLKPEDEVIILNPSFVSFIPQVLIAEPECKVINIDVSKVDFSLPLPELEKAITPKTKLLIVNTPNNPAGYMLLEGELTQLYNLAVKNNFFILSDEIYEKLHFGSRKHFSIGSLEEIPTKVITINGYSKSHAMTGWRLGYACFPKSLFSDLQKIQMHTNTNTCTFIQEGVAKAADVDMTYLDDYNLKLKQRINWYKEMLERNKKVSGIIPQGGFFAFLNISELGMDSNTFCSRLINETGVATTPGIAFGENWDDHVRISFATDDTKVIEGLELIEQFIKKIS